MERCGVYGDIRTPICTRGWGEWWYWGPAGPGERAGASLADVGQHPPWHKGPGLTGRRQENGMASWRMSRLQRQPEHPAGSQPGLAKGAISWGETQTARSSVGSSIAPMCRMGTPGLAGLGSGSCTPGLSGSPRLGRRCLRLPAGLQRCRQPRQLETRPQARRGLSSRTGRPRRGRGSATARGSRSRTDVPPRTRPRACPHRKTRQRRWLSGTGNPRGFGHVAGLGFATRNRRQAVAGRGGRPGSAQGSGAS